MVIDDGRCEVLDDHVGESDVHVRADAASWLRYLRKDTGLLVPLLLRRIKVSGSLRLLDAFGRCFP